MRSRLHVLNFKLITVLSITTDFETDSDFELDQFIKSCCTRNQMMECNSDKVRSAQVEEI